jgi:hypothetical protein
MSTTTTTHIYNNEELIAFLDNIHKEIDISSEDSLVLEMSAPYGDPYVIDVKATAVSDSSAYADAKEIERFIAKYSNALSVIARAELDSLLASAAEAAFDC